MSFFGKILEKLGIGSARAAEAPAGAAPATTAPAATPAAAPAAAGGAIPVVDVVAQLEQRAAANPQKLNWRTSIVDLLKLLGLDSSLDARKELANELHCPQDKMTDSGTMNIWLHKTIMQKLATHGGNVPPELLH